MRYLLIFLVCLLAGPVHAQQLGTLGSSRYDPDSLSNPYGRFGSPYSVYSVSNPYGYAGRYSVNPPRIYSSGGTYLGELSADPYRLDSVSNRYGVYGSPYSTESVRNPYGRYGNPYSSERVWVYRPSW